MWAVFAVPHAKAGDVLEAEDVEIREQISSIMECEWQSEGMCGQGSGSISYEDKDGLFTISTTLLNPFVGPPADYVRALKKDRANIKKLIKAFIPKDKNIDAWFEESLQLAVKVGDSFKASVTVSRLKVSLIYISTTAGLNGATNIAIEELPIFE